MKENNFEEEIEEREVEEVEENNLEGEIEEDLPQEEIISNELDNNKEEIAENNLEEDIKEINNNNLKESVEEVANIPDEINEEELVEEKVEEKEEEVVDENKDLKQIDENIKKILKNNPKLLNRVENKYDFVVETVNAPSNQKLSNLEDYEIDALLKRREFLNYLKMHGKIWSLVAQLVEKNVCDIENYSLSKKGFLPKLSLIENVRQYSLTHSAELKKLRREDAELV